MYLAVLARVAVRAGAFVGAVPILASTSVLTRPRVALVHVMLTVTPGKSRQTHARERVDAVDTSSTVKTRAGGGSRNE